MPEAQLTGSLIAVKPKDFLFLVRSTLKRLGCQITDVNKEYRQVIARDHETYPGKHNWQIEYLIHISWTAGDSQTQFDVTVSDRKNNWSQPFCDKRARAIVDAILADAKIKPEAPEESTLYGSAKWATEDDLRKAGYIYDDVDADRLLVAPWKKPEFISIPKSQTAWHALVCGPTGAGKSTGIFIPNLYARIGSSAIVTEATAGNEAPDLYMKTAGWRAAGGHKIYLFNPADMSSTRINPIDTVRAAQPHERVSLADALSNVVILNTTPPESQRSDPIWDKTEKHLLTIFIMHGVETDPGLCHFGALRRLMTKPEKQLGMILSNSASSFAAQEFTAFYSHSSENFRHGAYSGLLYRLSPWTSEPIVRLTSTTDLDVESLKNELFTFYLSVPSRKTHLKPLAALVFNFLLDLVLDCQFKHPMTLLLDEFTNFGYIPGIDEALSIIRRRNLSCVLGIQDFKQVESVYRRDKAEIIMSQLGTRIFFRPRSMKTAKEISDSLGQQTISDRKILDSGHLQERDVGRPLFAPSDLMSMSSDGLLLMTPSTRPILCPRFMHNAFGELSNFQPPSRTQHPVVNSFVDRPASSQRKSLPSSGKKVRSTEPNLDDDDLYIP